MKDLSCLYSILFHFNGNILIRAGIFLPDLLLEFFCVCFYFFWCISQKLCDAFSRNGIILLATCKRNHCIILRP